MRQTAVAVDLDPQTVEDLQPPCDVTWRWLIASFLGRALDTEEHPCDQPATWIVFRTCRCGARGYQLQCDKHTKQQMQWICGHCQAMDSFTDVRAERLT